MADNFTSNCFDLTASYIEIDINLVIRFLVAAGNGDVSTIEECLQAGVPADIVNALYRTALM